MCGIVYISVNSILAVSVHFFTLRIDMDQLEDLLGHEEQDKTGGSAKEPTHTSAPYSCPVVIEDNLESLPNQHSDRSTNEEKPEDWTSHSSEQSQTLSDRKADSGSDTTGSIAAPGTQETKVEENTLLGRCVSSICVKLLS